MKKLIVILVAAVVATMSAASADRQTVGLVLSGGGSKGIAHIGFIQALEEEEIPIDYITGTSMGAIVGSLYAIGYSPAEMIELLRSPGFARWSSGQITQEEKTLLLEPGQTPAWAEFNLGIQGGNPMNSILPTRLINPIPMSFAFMEIYSPAARAAGDDFDKLMVPFRCVASDIYTHKPVVFSDGQLADAVRASMSFPLVFQAIEVNDTVMVDGGLYDVYPVNVMERDFNPDRIIGVDVSTPNTPPTINDLVGQIENMIMVGETGVVPPDKGINVKLDLSKYGLLDWDKAETIYAVGYRRGKELADSIKSRITARRTPEELAALRSRFRSRIRPLDFEGIEIYGGSEGQQRYVRDLFGHYSEGNLTLEKAHDGFYRTASTGRMCNLVPHAIYSGPDSADILSLKIDVRKPLDIGVGGYLTTSNGSFIYAGARYCPMDKNAFGAAIEGRAGQAYLSVYGAVSRDFPATHPQRVTLDAQIERSRLLLGEKLFYDFSSPAFLTDSRAWVRGRYQFSTTTNGIATGAIGFAHLTDRYRNDVSAESNSPAERVIANRFFASVGWNYYTLNDILLPTTGLDIEAKAMALVGRRRIEGARLPYADNSAVGEFTARFRGYFPLVRRLSLGVSAEAFYSTRKLLPGYTASMADAHAFAPLPSLVDIYDPEFRANQSLSLGLHPVVSLSRLFQVRLDGWLYLPMRRILPGADVDGIPTACYSEWFDRAEFVGQLSVALKLPIGAVRTYGSYRTSNNSRWHVGLSLGLPLRGPSM